ncbi:uncharacterized protein LOC102679626 [Apis dorsata]|uniref:uncharacterized protein LOC102679626 n=1 Tax=Apis dorsata TaxID=7462 RepID=UPI0003DF777A|nr:uncharacterized protein LOC102679626 [Apis dorsata]
MSHRVAAELLSRSSRSWQLHLPLRSMVGMNSITREIGKIMGTSGWADAAGNKYSWNRIDHRAGDRRKNHPSSNFTIRHQIDSHEVFDEMTNNGETEDENHSENAHQ